MALRTTHTLAILISGKAGVGKTTLSNLLIKYVTENVTDLTIKNFPFAGGLKDHAYKLGWRGIKDDRGRKFLQNLGKVGREFNPDIWVSMALKKHESDKNYPLNIVTFDDWRFPNELSYIDNNPLYKVLTVRVLAPDRELLSGDLCKDVSEISLTDDMHYDLVLDNSKESDTYNHPDQIWNSIQEIRKDVFTWI